MEPSTEKTETPSAGECQTNFEQAVAYSLHLWPALTMAVQNGWGGPDSADKRDWFAGAVVELFLDFADTTPRSKTYEEPDTEYVETFLLQVMFDEFDVNTDDDSGLEVAENIIRARAQCAIGQFDEVEKLAERYGNLAGKKVNTLFNRAEDVNQDTDWDSDEDDSDEDDEQAFSDTETASVPVPKTKPAPEVDDDGFTKVSYKKK